VLCVEALATIGVLEPPDSLDGVALVEVDAAGGIVVVAGCTLVAVVSEDVGLLCESPVLRRLPEGSWSPCSTI
jgi:hypothetical protein